MRQWKKVICFFGQTQQYINIWWSWPVFEEIFYSLKGKELNSCLYHSIEIPIMQEAIRMELQREMAQIIQCCQVTDAQNSLRSKQNKLQVLVKKKMKALWSLVWKVPVSLSIFSTTAFAESCWFGTNSASFSLNLLYFKDMKTCC